MTARTLKSLIDKTGVAFLTLFNVRGEALFCGNVETMKTVRGRLHLSWKLCHSDHVLPFTAYMIHDRAVPYYTEGIVPVRADMGLKRFDLEFDMG